MSSSDSDEGSIKLDFQNTYDLLLRHCPDLASLNITKTDVARHSVISVAVQTSLAQKKRWRKELRKRGEEEDSIKILLDQLAALGVQGVGDDDKIADDDKSLTCKFVKFALELSYFSHLKSFA